MQASISVSIPIETITIIMLLDTMLKLIILGTIIIHEKCIKSLLKELVLNLCSAHIHKSSILIACARGRSFYVGQNTGKLAFILDNHMF
jgi:hypothetical protein